MNGVIYVAFGHNARQEATASIISLRQHNDLPVTVVCDATLDIEDVECIPFRKPGPGARWAKLNIDNLAPEAWTNILYLDADTRIKASITAGFDLLADGWDMAIAPSTCQDHDALWHLSGEERALTLSEIVEPLQLQAGVMFINRRRCAALFAAWRDEWQRFGDQDQGALLRALKREPVRVYLLGRDWNGGAVIEHLFGRAR